MNCHSVLFGDRQFRKFPFIFQERTSLQEKMENDRRELEQSHLRNIRDTQKRLSELEETTKVCRLLITKGNIYIFMFIF